MKGVNRFLTVTFKNEATEIASLDELSFTLYRSKTITLANKKNAEYAANAYSNEYDISLFKDYYFLL